MRVIEFNIPPYIGKENEYVNEAIMSGHICGDGEFTKRCRQNLEERLSKKVLLTTSCTSALEMAAILCDIKPGDEVIMPAYTFVSTANAFVMRGADIVFVDIRPDTMNLDEKLIEAAITKKTKAVVPVHYAGVACEMDTINSIAKAHGLRVVEDDAQGLMSTYKGRPLGTLGDFGCISFHETKNYSMGEGGAIVFSEEDLERAEIIREKGTDRSRFFRGQIDKYRWVDCGSSYLPSELNAAYLCAQLENAEEINENRLRSFRRYYEGLKPLAQQGRIELPFIPDECENNGHMFYLKTGNLNERTKLISFLKENGIWAVFHYVPLHTAPAGLKFGRFAGEDRYTTKESERLVRLPMYYGLEPEQIDYIISRIEEFYR